MGFVGFDPVRLRRLARDLDGASLAALPMHRELAALLNEAEGLLEDEPATRDPGLKHVQHSSAGGPVTPSTVSPSFGMGGLPGSLGNELHGISAEIDRRLNRYEAYAKKHKFRLHRGDWIVNGKPVPNVKLPGKEHKDGGGSWWDGVVNTVGSMLSPDKIVPDAEIAFGAAVMAVGGVVGAGGIGFSATGAGAVAGVPAVAAGASIAAAGYELTQAGLKDYTWAAQDDGGSGSGTEPGSHLDPEPRTGASNRERPPVEGDTEYKVDNPNDWSDTITDIDRVDGGRFWEEKSVDGRRPGFVPEKWAARHVPKKLSSYLRARSHLDGWKDAPLGLDFTRPGATPELRAAVKKAVDDWKAENPGVDVKVRWAE